MATNDSKINGENDLLDEDEGYRSVTQGVGGTTTASETLDRVGSAASEFNDAGARPLDARAESGVNQFDERDAADDSPLKWIVPLVILAALIILGYWFCGNVPKAV